MTSNGTKTLLIVAAVAAAAGAAYAASRALPVSEERARELREQRDALTMLARKRRVRPATLLYPGGPSFSALRDTDDPRTLADAQRGMEGASVLLLAGRFATDGGVLRPSR